jgi:hypothetical protein
MSYEIAYSDPVWITILGKPFVECTLVLMDRCPWELALSSSERFRLRASDWRRAQRV